MPEWSDLPTWLKYCTAFGMLGIGVALWYAGIFAPWVWGIGIALLIAAMVFD